MTAGESTPAVRPDRRPAALETAPTEDSIELLNRAMLLARSTVAATAPTAAAASQDAEFTPLADNLLASVLSTFLFRPYPAFELPQLPQRSRAEALLDSARERLYAPSNRDRILKAKFVRGDPLRPLLVLEEEMDHP
jgi:hypothetical protein